MKEILKKDRYIVNMINSVKIPEDYMTLTPENRKEVCRVVLYEVMKKIKFGSNVKDINVYIEKVLKSTEEVYAKNEQYEAALLFADLNEVFNKEIRPNNAD